MKRIKELIQADPEIMEMLELIGELPEKERVLMLEVMVRAVTLMAMGEEGVTQKVEEVLQKLGKWME